MTELDLDSRVAVAPRMVLRLEGGDGGFLFDPDTARVVILNSTAVAIWNLLDGRRSVADIVAALAAEFDGAGPDAPAKVLAAVSTLLDKGAAEVVVA